MYSISVKWNIMYPSVQMENMPYGLQKLQKPRATLES